MTIPDLYRRFLEAQGITHADYSDAEQKILGDMADEMILDEMPITMFMHPESFRQLTGRNHPMKQVKPKRRRATSLRTIAKSHTAKQATRVERRLLLMEARHRLERTLYQGPRTMERFPYHVP